MDSLTPALIVVLLLVLAAEFVNGLTDAPNAIATVVSTHVLSPFKAVIMAAGLNILGVLLTGTAVATTIGKGIVRPEFIDLSVVAAAMLTIVLWSTIAWRYGIPTSESHELVAGLSGAGLAAAGPSVLLWGGWQKVLIGLGFSTFLGFVLSFVLMTGLYWLLRKTSTSSVRNIFGRLQIVSAGFMAFSHGSNDGQKFMGAFSLALVLGGAMTEFTIRALLLGLVMSVILGAANAYLGLRAGMTIAATYPAAVISMAVLRLFRGSVLEENFARTVGSIGESVAAGAIFTLPAFVILRLWTFDTFEDYLTASALMSDRASPANV